MEEQYHPVQVYTICKKTKREENIQNVMRENKKTGVKYVKTV